MYRQDIPELQGDLPFREYGCKLMSYYYFLEQVLPAHFISPDDIVYQAQQMIISGILGKDLTIRESCEYMVPHYLGIPIKESKRTGPEYICKSNELEILWLHRKENGHEYNHFVPGDGRGNYSWDPLGIRPQQRRYQVAGKRIMII